MHEISVATWRIRGEPVESKAFFSLVEGSVYSKIENLDVLTLSAM